MTMHTYAVGQPYPSPITHWPDGTVQLRYQGATNWDCLFALDRITDAEALAFGQAPMRVGIVELNEILLLLYDIPGVANGSAPFEWHRLRAPRPSAPPTLAPGERCLLQVTLIDASTSIIRRLRVVSLSPRVSYALHEAVRGQAQRPAALPDYDARLASVLSAHTDKTLASYGVIDRVASD